MRLTEAGRALVQRARETLASADAALHAARQAARATPTLRFACLDWPHRAVLVADAVARLKQEWGSEVELAYDSAPWTVSAKNLRAHAIDVGFGIVPDPAVYGPGIRGDFLMPEPGSCAIIPAQHPLAQRKSVRLADLRDIPALVPPAEQVGALHDMMIGLIRSGGYEPKVVPAPLNFSAATQMVFAGAGWIISVLSIGEFVPPGTAVLPIEDASFMCGLFALTREDDDRPVVRAFVEALKAAATSRAVSAT